MTTVSPRPVRAFGYWLFVLPVSVLMALAPVAWSPNAFGLSILPIAVADSYTTPHDRVETVSAANGVLANDVNLLGSTTAVLASTTTHGTLSLNADGSFTYSPAAGFVGTDQFRYHDSGLLTNTVSVTISPPIRKAASMPITVTTGSIALRRA